MKIIPFIFAGLLTGLLISAQGQVEPPDTVQPPPPRKQLPSIQLQEYTIVGLEKVVLPKKERQPVFRKVSVSWQENMAIRERDLPQIDFQFSRSRGKSLSLYPFPWLQSEATYGSFQTLNLKLNTQLQTGNILPYLGVDYGNSDGHMENAQWSNNVFRGGIHGGVGSNTHFHLGTEYRQKKQGIYSPLFVQGREWETRTAEWDWNATLKQNFSNKISGNVQAAYSIAEQENAYKSRLNGLETGAGLQWSNNHTVFTVEGTYASRQVESDSLELAAPVDVRGEITNRLLSGRIQLQHTMDRVSVTGEALFQQWMFEQNGAEDDKSYVRPIAGISFQLSSNVNLSARYSPHSVMIDPGVLLQSFQLANFRGFAVTHYDQWIEGALNVEITPDLSLKITGNYQQAENYPVVFGIGSTPDSLWEYRFNSDVTIQENSLKLTWKPVAGIILEGWLQYRRAEFTGAFENNRLPYVPSLSSLLKFNWRIFRMLELQLSGEYAGERFDDPQNNTSLEPYLLLDARLQFFFTENISLVVYGKNLLDAPYEPWFTFEAPPICGGAGLAIKL